MYFTTLAAKGTDSTDVAYETSTGRFRTARLPLALIYRDALRNES